MCFVFIAMRRLHADEIGDYQVGRFPAVIASA
jgi:hypothetical protein